MSLEIQKPHPTPIARKFSLKAHVSADSVATHPKICRKHVQQKPPHPKIRWNPCTSCITKKSVNRFAAQINWLVSRRDELLAKGISKQTEFRFLVSEQALADNRSINKWQVTCSMYNLFDRCNFCKVSMGSFLDTKI